VYVEGVWQQSGLNDEHVPGLHLPGVDAGCGVVEASRLVLSKKFIISFRRHNK
jgi:hypothetical protein